MKKFTYLVVIYALSCSAYADPDSINTKGGWLRNCVMSLLPSDKVPESERFQVILCGMYMQGAIEAYSFKDMEILYKKDVSNAKNAAEAGNIKLRSSYCFDNKTIYKMTSDFTKYLDTESSPDSTPITGVIYQYIESYRCQ